MSLDLGGTIYLVVGLVIAGLLIIERIFRGRDSREEHIKKRIGVVCGKCGSKLEDHSNDDYISIWCLNCKEQRVSGTYYKRE